MARERPVERGLALSRSFDLGTPAFVLAAAVGLLVLGFVLLALGLLLAGLIAIVFGLCLLPVFLAWARRWPDSPLARIGVGAADRVRDEAGVAVESLSTWSRAGREVARLRKAQFQLRRERDAKIRQLGPSFYADDGRADELKAAAKELDERIAANERHLQRTVAGARRHTRRERAAVATTEIREPEPVEVVSSASAVADEPLARSADEPKRAPRRAPKKKAQARSR